MLRRFSFTPMVFNPIYYCRQSVTLTHKNCWKCGQSLSLNLVFCAQCRAIQPVYNDDFFSYFGLEQTFSISEDNLKQRFRQLQSLVHPDKFGKSSEKEKELSESHSSFLNQAYKTLLDPRSRAFYILKLVDKDKTIKDDEFAIKIMELNEQYVDLVTIFFRIEELDDVEAIKKTLSDVNNEIKSLNTLLEESLQKRDFDQANKSLHRLNFYDRTKKLLMEKIK